jgi:hypothetical protein
MKLKCGIVKTKQKMDRKVSFASGVLQKDTYIEPIPWNGIR